MKKQMIVVVHGVGVKEAGVSSDLLAVSLFDKELTPISSDDFNIAEDAAYNESDKRQVYPCRIRQYANAKRKRVIADFYWGDITNSQRGILGLWIALFKTIMGLGHVIRESASEVYRESPKGKWIASFIVKVLHGPIVAINLVMLIGVLIAWILEQVSKQDGGGVISPVLIAAVAVGGGLLLRARARSYLERSLWCWVVLTGVALLALQILSLVIPQSGMWLESLRSAAVHLICTTGGADCSKAISGIYFDGILLLMFVQSCSLLNLFLLLFLSVWFSKSRNTSTGEPVPNIVFSSFMLMTVMWIFLIACVWILTVTSWWQLIPHDDIQNFGLRILLAVVPILVLILIVSSIVLLNRMSWAGRVRQYWQNADYFGNEIKNAELHRVIVNSKITGLMYLAFVFYTLLSVYILFALDRADYLGGIAFFDFISSLISKADEFYPHMLWFVLFSAVGITGFAYLVRDGIDVAADIITYLNDYSWESETSGTMETQTFLEKWFSLKTPAVSKLGYYNRRRIKQRLEMLVERLVLQEKPDEIYLIAHSQGTAIAIDVIAEYGDHWKSIIKPNAIFGLVTMGSPYTHIYNHYFPSSFPKISSRPGLRPAGKGGLLKSWNNIFRLDDFVGTHIDPTGKWPSEHPVPPNGHTNYWVDVNVAKILRKVLEF